MFSKDEAEKHNQTPAFLHPANYVDGDIETLYMEEIEALNLEDSDTRMTIDALNGSMPDDLQKKSDLNQSSQCSFSPRTPRMLPFHNYSLSSIGSMNIEHSYLNEESGAYRLKNVNPPITIL